MSIIPIAAAAEGQAPAPQHDIQHYLRAGSLQLAALPPLSLYIHLPWCLTVSYTHLTLPTKRIV